MKALTRPELRSALVERRADDHKGVFGHVLIVAGSRGMLGAAVLSARAALRSGAGLVTLAVPASLQSAAAAQALEALTLGLPENSSGCLRPDAVGRLKASHKERGYTTLAIGPGLSTHADTARFVLLALSNLPLPAVIDADALNILAAEEGQGVRQLMSQRREGCIFTPHPGEAARCLGMDRRELSKDRAGAAERMARDWSGVTLLKGQGTVVSSGGRTVLNTTGGPGLAKGGTGDVLTGLVAGLWAQSLAAGKTGDVAFWAAALGAWLHGTAGDLAEKELTPQAMTASDVIDRLPQAFKRL
ncbi:MAG: NAD(P)H-hydrate dehydratase [Elusimicrobiota bacterium]